MDRIKNFLGVAIENFALLRQRQFPSLELEKFYAQLLFERFDLLRNGRGSQKATLCSFFERAALNDPAKTVELAKLHWFKKI